MLIFGRSPNLLLALLTGTFNLVVLFSIGGFAPNELQIAGVNAFFALLIAFIANDSGTQQKAGIAANNRRLKSEREARVNGGGAGGSGGSGAAGGSGGAGGAGGTGR